MFFKPQKAEGQYPSIVSSVGLSATPDIEAGFYLDVTVRAIDAVERLKRSGPWPDLTYTKCSEFTGDTPIQRSLNLAAAIQVLTSLSSIRVFSY